MVISTYLNIKKRRIKHLLLKHFDTDGPYEIDESLWVVNVHGDVSLTSSEFTTLPVTFGEVTGSFSCFDKGLISLKGSPHTVGRDFNCSNNKLQSLQGGPHTLSGGGYWCYSNRLTDLHGAPSQVPGVFQCYNNNLNSLEGAPKSVAGTFACDHNPLISLAGAPEHVGDMFYISYHPHLPLLRTLVATQVIFTPPYPAIVQTILDKYTRQGKAGMLKAAAELIRAGHREHAKW